MSDIGLSPQNVPNDRAREIHEMLNREGNVIDWLWEYVAPSMAGRQRARTAVLLMLASPGDRNGMRGRIHVLLPGEPGTGKSVLRDWLKYQVPGTQAVSPDSSDAGLRYDANLHEPGKLHKADGAVIGIEEFDKWAKAERDACYEAMSEGYYEVAKSGVDREFRAETRVFAVCNDLPFKPALQDRFDLSIEMDQYSAEETVTVGERVYDTFRDSFIRDEGTDERPLIPDFLSVIAHKTPDLPEPTHERIKQSLRLLVDHDDEFVGGIREKEAYMRIAYTIARLNARDIRVTDWHRAVDLAHPEVDAAELFAEIPTDDPLTHE